VPYRVFASPDGVIWRAWDIPGTPETGPGIREQMLREGWLCFECDQEKRRLSPVPQRWSERSEEQLWLYCRVAESVRTTDPEQSAEKRARLLLLSVKPTGRSDP
jgi:hypothetical protein